MEPLEGPIRRYAWGSQTAIAGIQGRAAPTGPEAELWLGAHPASPSVLVRPSGGLALTEAIAEDPPAVLGQRTVSRFGPRLPFLLKVLAAAEPLSLQAHPDLAQAAAGFGADEAAGIALGAPNRTYADQWHKPELLVAVSDFEALCGFRDPGESASLLKELGVGSLEPTMAALNASDPGEGLRSAVRGLLSYPGQERESLVAETVGAARRAVDRHPEYELAVRLAELYPTDVGVIVAMLLNYVTLTPGQAVWMPAGNLHAYVRGVGVEIMAASDNVLRGGLTPKFVNVDELLRVLRFEVLHDPVVAPVGVADGVVTWPVPVPDFTLTRVTATEDGIVVPGQGPRILLCLSGAVRCREGESRVETELSGGQAAFVADGPTEIAIAGTGEVYLAGVG